MDWFSVECGEAAAGVRANLSGSDMHPVHPNEKRRLEVLHELDVFGTPPEPSSTHSAGRAGCIGVPIALVSLVGEGAAVQGSMRLRSPRHAAWGLPVQLTPFCPTR